MHSMLERAIGLSFHGKEGRKYHFGAFGIRSDGAIVSSTNGGTRGERTPSAHCEARLSRKLDVASIVFVARTTRSGAVALARPCVGCQLAMKHRGVAKCYYTISSNEYGVLVF